MGATDESSVSVQVRRASFDGLGNGDRNYSSDENTMPNTISNGSVNKFAHTDGERLEAGLLETKPPPKQVNWWELFESGLLVLIWYISSAISNNLNKTILDASVSVLPFPLTLTFFQFGFISLSCLIIFKLSSSSSSSSSPTLVSTRLQQLDKNLLTTVLIPLCLSQISAHLLTQISVQQVPVSFVHTVKAASPVFAILLSIYYKFNEQYTPTLLLSILFIMVGVVLSSLTEINFTFVGFITALASALVFSWQNTYSKKVFRNKEMDHINLLFYTSLCSFVALIPVWLLHDIPQVIETIKIHDRDHYSLLTTLGLFFFDGLCHFGQNITAFTFMTKVTPLTYTVFNTSKRIVVIVSSILYFHNSVPFFNGLGIAIALSGVALYNKAKYDQRQGSSKVHH